MPGFLHDPYLDHHPEIVLRGLPGAGREPRPERRQRGRQGLVPRRAAVHRGALLRRRPAPGRPRDGLGEGARGLREPDRGVPGRLRSSSPTRSPSCSPPGCSPTTRRTRSTRSPDRKIVHGKVSMAKLYASEMAGRVADRAAPGPRRPRLHDRAARRRASTASSGRSDLGGDERDPAAHPRPRSPEARRGPVPRLNPRSGYGT